MGTRFQGPPTYNEKRQPMRHHRYSGGHNVRESSIRELNATTWPELVERYINHPIQINITREDFHALPPDKQKEVKNVAFMTACSFLDYSAGRSDANAYKLELAFFDIDDGDLAKQIWSDYTVLGDQLGDLNFALHMTISHTPENPRLRLIVDIEPMPVDRHPSVIAHIARLLGVTSKWSGFRESNVLSQPMFRSCMFQNETAPPVLASRTNGRALTMEEVELEELITGTPEVRKFAAVKFDADESIEFMPLRVTLDEVKAALHTIDPDCPYRTWYETAAAMRHQFREEDEAAAAFAAWDEWSAKGTKYPSGGEDDTFAKWKSFRPFRVGSPPVTIRTLFFHAIAAGWNIAPTQDRLVKEFLQWVAEQTSETGLSQGFAARIRSLPSLTTLMEHTLCQKVAKRYSELSGSKVSAAVIQKQLREDIRKANAKEESESTPAWLRPFVYVSTDNKFVNTTNMVEYAPDAFNFTFNEHLMPDESEGGRPPIMATDFATNVIKIPKVVSRIYDPRYNGSEPIFTHNGVSYLNTYMNTHPEPDATTSELAGSILKAHLAHLIAEPEYQLHTLDWAAYLVQKPGGKIRHAILIQSVQGAGKGLFLEALKGGLGPTNVKSVSNNIIASQWSDWMIGAQLICIEEMHVQGQSRKAVMNGIKEFITNDRIPINKRNTSAFEVDNVCNCICFTNEEAAASLDEGERRYFVIKSPLRTRDQVEALAATGHFAQLARLGDPKDLAPGLRHFLLNYKIRDTFDPNGLAPRTIYMDEMVDDSESSGVSLIKDTMDDPTHVYVTPEFVSVRHLNAIMGSNYAQPSRYLRELNFVKIGRLRVGGGYPTDVWAPRGSNPDTVKDLIRAATPTEI